MDKQKLIKEFEEICGYTMRQHEMQVLNDVLDLLKEQEPVEVIHHEAPYGYPFNTGKCPVCFQQLDEGDKFCRECGQAVKWK